MTSQVTVRFKRRRAGVSWQRLIHSHNSHDTEAAAPPRGVAASGSDYWIGIVVSRRGKNVEVQWYEYFETLDDGGRMFKEEDEPLYELEDGDIGIIPLVKKLTKKNKSSKTYAVPSHIDKLIIAALENMP